MKIIFKLFLVVFACYLVSCATIISTNKQCITVNSTPAGASVVIDGKKIGTAPLFCQLKRKTPHTIKLELDGYQPYNVTLNQRVNPWRFINFVIGPYGLPGFFIDRATGSCYILTPGDISINLSPVVSEPIGNTK